MGGYSGAFIAHSMIYGLGILAWLVPVPFLTTSILNRKIPLSLSRMVGWTLLFLCLSLSSGSWIQSLQIDDVSFPSSGQLGIVLSDWSKRFLGPAGAISCVIFGILCSYNLITHRTITESLKGFFIYVVKIIKDKKQEIKAQAEIKAPIRSAEELTDETYTAPNFYNPSQEKITPDLNSVTTDDPKTMEISDLDTKEETSSNIYTPPSHTFFRQSAAMEPLTIEEKQEFEQTAKELVCALEDFLVKGKVSAIQPGPVVTVYEFEPLAGTKISKMTGLIDDIALALKVDSIFMHPVSGKRVVGIQVPNKKRQTVFLGDVIKSADFNESASPLTFAMGKTLKGSPYCGDLATMPHLLMAGQTGAGKSVAINSLLCSLIMKASPDQVRMILVDPKILELKVYEGIPHLMMPVITEPSRASLALKWATQEMDRRYRLMELTKVRQIAGFNSFWEKASTEKKAEIRGLSGDDNVTALPFIVIVIDELADLMLTAPKDVEGSIQRLAQKARASGIHLVLATQRPSVDVITGVIKANLPCRIAFKVFSRGDSRTILDSIGADKLLGKGDMLFLKPGQSRLERLQGAFLEDEEVVELVEEVKGNTSASYDDTAISWIDNELEKESQPSGGSESSLTEDAKWDEACWIAQKQGTVSASYLQRQLKIGYNRAARIVELMETQGLVGHSEGSKPRKWLRNET